MKWVISVIINSMMFHMFIILFLNELLTVYPFVKMNKALATGTLNIVKSNLKSISFKEKLKNNVDRKKYLDKYNKDVDEFWDKMQRKNLEERDSDVSKKISLSKFGHSNLTSQTTALRSITQDYIKEEFYTHQFHTQMDRINPKASRTKYERGKLPKQGHEVMELSKVCHMKGVERKNYSTENLKYVMPNTSESVRINKRNSNVTYSLNMRENELKKGLVKSERKLKYMQSKNTEEVINNPKLRPQGLLVYNHEDWLANTLKTDVRVLCCVALTEPQKLNHSWHIMATWGKRCTKLLFVSTQPYASDPVVRLNTTDSNSTWSMTKEAIRYLYDNHLSDADWFLKTDDKTYVIMENLRYMLSKYNPNESLYFDCQFNTSLRAKNIMTNSGGFVLSRELLKKFGFSSTNCTQRDDHGSCLQHLSIKSIDTRDSLRRGRFFFSLDALFPDMKMKHWVLYFINYPHSEGMACCSDFGVSFHQMTVERMHVMEYLVYHLRPYGVRFISSQVSQEIKTLNRLKQTIKLTQSRIGAYRKELDRIYADRSEADELTKRIRVLCWVMTCPENHEKRAIHVKATWGKRCNVLLFMSSKFDPTLPTIKLPVKEGRVHLWGKTKAAFSYVHKHHRKDADWFMKVDDDAYVVVENLRYMLSKYDPQDPMYFGLRYHFIPIQGIMSGGPGYVLSSAALDKFVTEGLPNPSLCKHNDTGNEDLVIGVCLANIGVKAMDSRDSMQRGRFFQSSLRGHFFPHLAYWLKKVMFYGMPEGLECCSKYAISFHRIISTQMYVMEYLIYHLKPYGYFWNGTESEKMLSLKLDLYPYFIKPTENPLDSATCMFKT